MISKEEVKDGRECAARRDVGDVGLADLYYSATSTPR